jgi:aryl-alcohol dehydrogenase-like predicted oxidoreductase
MTPFSTAARSRALPISRWGPLAAKPFAPEAPLARATGAIAQVASDLGATPGQVALAWLLRRSPNVILIPGTTSIAHLEENVAAAAIRLSAEQFAALSANAG